MSCADRSVALVTGSAALGAAVIPALEKEGFSTHSALSDAHYGLERDGTGEPGVRERAESYHPAG